MHPIGGRERDVCVEYFIQIKMEMQMEIVVDKSVY